ncbi:MAG: hypothetical protein ABI977_02435, partial [Acidobacteriota bacterium]
ILTIFNLNLLIFLGLVNAPPSGKFHDVLNSVEKLVSGLIGSISTLWDGGVAGKEIFSKKV